VSYLLTLFSSLLRKLPDGKQVILSDNQTTGKSAGGLFFYPLAQNHPLLGIPKTGR
jgi:hypothetical protein